MVRVNISNIVVNKHMHKVIKEAGINVNFENTGTIARLSRFNSPNLKRIVEFQSYNDPVALKKRSDGKYIVIQGRHRVSMSIIKRFKTIEANIING